jgi:hypothetical protein
VSAVTAIVVSLSGAHPTPGVGGASS